jgi:hypothetical protein
MQFVSHFAAVASLLALLFTAAPASAGSISVSHSLGGRAQAGAGPNPVVDPFADINERTFELQEGDHETNTALYGDAGGLATFEFNESSAGISSYASAQVGRVGVSIQGIVIGVNDAGNSAIATIHPSHVEASWQEDIFFNSDELPPGFLVALHSKLRVAGQLVATMDGGPIGGFRGGRVQLTAAVVPINFVVANAGLGVRIENLDHSESIDTFANQEVDIALLATNKQTVSRGVGVIVTAQAVASSQLAAAGYVIGEFNGALAHTLTWGGITHVTNAETGEEITDYTITSESGFDYTKPFPAPEPACPALLAVAAVAALGRRSGTS